MKLLKVFLFVSTCVSLSICQSLSASEDRYLSLPKLNKCNSRFKEAKYKDRNFFFSGHNPELKDKRLDWLDSRNTCREYCMETVSFETQEKFDFYKKFIDENKIPFIWTSGRLCDFDGCEGRWDLLPKIIKGWLWSANQMQLDDTNKTPTDWNYQPWSFTGTRKKPQPDNAEFYLSQTQESCIGVLNNMYNDSIAFHDIACYHKARFICEDSELLLQEVLEIKEEEVSNDNVENAANEKTVEVDTTTKKNEIEISERKDGNVSKKLVDASRRPEKGSRRTENISSKIENTFNDNAESMKKEKNVENENTTRNEFENISKETEKELKTVVIEGVENPSINNENASERSEKSSKRPKKEPRRTEKPLTNAANIENISNDKESSTKDKTFEITTESNDFESSTKQVENALRRPGKGSRKPTTVKDTFNDNAQRRVSKTDKIYSTQKTNEFENTTKIDENSPVKTENALRRPGKAFRKVKNTLENTSNDNVENNFSNKTEENESSTKANETKSTTKLNEVESATKQIENVLKRSEKTSRRVENTLRRNEKSGRTKIEETTESKVVNAKQENQFVEKESSKPKRRRKLVRKKLLSNNNDDTIRETVSKPTVSAENANSPLIVVKINLGEKEILNSTDDVKNEDEIVDEIEITTYAEIKTTTTKKSLFRNRNRSRSRF